MKILHVETGRHLYGGPQQVVYLMAALKERGHDGTLVCPPASGVDSAARIAELPVRNLFCAGDLDLPFAYRLVQYINESRPDIVHCHSRRGADVLGGLAASFADVPAVVSRRVDNTEMQLIAALRYRPFKKIIAISHAIADVLEDRGVERDRMVVIRDAVDVDAVQNQATRKELEEEFAIPAGVPVIASAGQLIARKGHRFLLQAARDLLQRGDRFRLLMFGEGGLENELREQAQSLGLGEVAQFVGFRADLDRYFGCFDILAHPALAEGMGVVTLKAQAARVPVVGFAAGGLVEAVADGETGYLVEPEDVSALGNALHKLLADDELRHTMGAAGEKRMRQDFSVGAMADRHGELYEEVLNGGD